MTIDLDRLLGLQIQCRLAGSEPLAYRMNEATYTGLCAMWQDLKTKTLWGLPIEIDESADDVALSWKGSWAGPVP